METGDWRLLMTTPALLTNQRVFTISQAAKALDISPKTLRRWEKLGLVKPKRTKGRQRRFAKSDLVILSKKMRSKKHETRRQTLPPRDTGFATVTINQITPLHLIQEDFMQSARLLTKGSTTIFSTALIALLILGVIVLYVLAQFLRLFIGPIFAVFSPIVLYLSVFSVGIIISVSFGALLFVIITSEFFSNSFIKSHKTVKIIRNDIFFGAYACAVILNHLYIKNVQKFFNLTLSKIKLIYKNTSFLHFNYN